MCRKSPGALVAGGRCWIGCILSRLSGDKNGQKHIYEVTETDVVNPYDNSIKTQGDEKELTLFTCSQKGTMRFVVRCIYKEAEMDE